MPLNSLETLLSRYQSSEPATRRVMLALNPQEQEMFFPKGFHLAGFEVSRYEYGWNPKKFLDSLRQHNPEAIVTSWSTPHFQVEWREALTELRYICHTSGSVRNLVPRSFLENGILVTNWGSLVASQVAEHALLLILAGLRCQTEWASIISGERQWQPSPLQTRTLFGKRVGIHGFGFVARSLVTLLRPFGVSISAYSEGVPEELFAQFRVKHCSDLEALFANCDILVECEALTSRTQGSVTASLLNQLPDQSLFVNVGRGAVVDEETLAALAAIGRIHVALDVYAQDPISPDSPLHKVKDAILSPHIAGPTMDRYVSFGELAIRNLHAFFAGEKLEGEVDLDIYDRST